MTLSVIMTLSLIKCLNTQEYAQLWSEAECNGVDAYDGWINDRMQCAGFNWIFLSQESENPFRRLCWKVLCDFFCQISLQRILKKYAFLFCDKVVNCFVGFH